MKTFYIIILVFTAMTFCIFINASLLNKFADDSIKRLEEIEFSEDEDFESRISPIVADMTAKLRKFEFSIQRKKINSLNDNATLLLLQAKLRLRADFEMTRSLLINQLQEICSTDKISISNIF